MQRTRAVLTSLAALALVAPICFSGALRARGLQTPSVAKPTEVLRAVAIAVDSSGNILTVEGGRVRKLTPEGVLRNVAGTGRQGYSGDGGPAVDAGFEYPDDVAVDAKGNIYVADNLGHRIRLITPDGKIQTFAGTGTPGYGGDAGPASAAKLQSPVRIALDAAGNLYIGDSGNGRVRKVTPAGMISTLAGTGREGFTGDNGPANSASIGQISGLAVDRAGNVYIGDSDNSRIRKVTAATGNISTFAGNGAESSAGDGGPALKAAVQPLNLAMDAAGNLLIVEVNRIRRVTADGVIRTIAGNGAAGFSGDGSQAASALLRGPSAVAVDAKANLFIADTLNGRIRKVSATGVIETIAGSTPPPPPSSMLSMNQGTRGLPPGINVNVNFGNPVINVPPPPPVTVAPSGRPMLLETRLGMIPHPPLTTVKDCGHVPKEGAQTAVTCVEEAMKTKAPFFASFEQKGIDSQVVIGLGGTAPEVVQVLFDSNSGAGARGNPRVSAPRDCAEPKLTVASGAVQVVCK